MRRLAASNPGRGRFRVVERRCFDVLDVRTIISADNGSDSFRRVAVLSLNREQSAREVQGQLADSGEHTYYPLLSADRMAASVQRAAKTGLIAWPLWRADKELCQAGRQFDRPGLLA